VSSEDEASACAKLVSLKCAIVEELDRLPFRNWAGRVHLFSEELALRDDEATTRVLLMDVWMHLRRAVAQRSDPVTPEWMRCDAVQEMCDGFRKDLASLLDRRATELAALDRVLEIEQLVRANLVGLTVRMLARKAGATVRELRKLIERHFHQTPRQFIAACRAAEAGKLIAAGWKREAAAAAVGLHHRGNLNVQMRKQLGIRPGSG
jgi:AraC-like DNA-binding protein